MVGTTSSTRARKAPRVVICNDQTEDPATTGNPASRGPIVKVEYKLDDAFYMNPSEMKSFDEETKSAVKIIEQNRHCSV